MRAGLQAGHQFEFSFAVTAEMKAQLQGVVVHELFGTASMIQQMEWASRQHILPYLEPGEDGVGYHVDVRHLNPTPIGATVTVRSTVTGVTPDKITTHVEAWQGVPEQLGQKIGDGTLVQAIVPLEKLQARTGKALLQDSEKEPPANTALSEDVPLLAELVSPDGASRFAISLLKWETPFPCTRYDEWLICRVHMGRDKVIETQEGAFLLRYEVEEWLEGLQNVLSGQQGKYQSEFMETAIKVKIEASRQDPDGLDLLLHLSEPSPTSLDIPHLNVVAAKPVVSQMILPMTVTRVAAEQFADALNRQLGVLIRQL